MTKHTLRPFDPADYLADDDSIAVYLTEALASQNAAQYLLAADIHGNVTQFNSAHIIVLQFL